MAGKTATKSQQLKLLTKYGEGIPVSEIAKSFKIDVDLCVSELAKARETILPGGGKGEEAVSGTLKYSDLIEVECEKEIERCSKTDKKRRKTFEGFLKSTIAGRVSLTRYLASEEYKRRVATE